MSRGSDAQLLMEMFFGHSALQARVFVQLPKPSSSILLNMALHDGKPGLPLGQQIQLALP